MPDDFARVNPGDDMSFSARAWNAVLDAARAFASGRGVGPADDVGARQASVVTLKNEANRPLPRGGVLAVDGPIIAPSDNIEGFLNEVALRGVVPGESVNPAQGRFVIALDPLAPGMIGRAAAAGVTYARLNLVDSSHTCAGAVPHNMDSLESMEDGPVMVLWCENGAPGYATPGLQWAAVRFGTQCPPEPPPLVRFRVTLTMWCGRGGNLTPALDGTLVEVELPDGTPVGSFTYDHTDPTYIDAPDGPGWYHVRYTLPDPWGWVRESDVYLSVGSNWLTESFLLFVSVSVGRSYCILLDSDDPLIHALFCICNDVIPWGELTLENDDPDLELTDGPFGTGYYTLADMTTEEVAASTLTVTYKGCTLTTTAPIYDCRYRSVTFCDGVGGVCYGCSGLVVEGVRVVTDKGGSATTDQYGRYVVALDTAVGYGDGAVAVTASKTGFADKTISIEPIFTVPTGGGGLATTGCNCCGGDFHLDNAPGYHCCGCADPLPDLVHVGLSSTGGVRFESGFGITIPAQSDAWDVSWDAAVGYWRKAVTLRMPWVSSPSGPFHGCNGLNKPAQDIDGWVAFDCLGVSVSTGLCNGAQDWNSPGITTGAPYVGAATLAVVAPALSCDPYVASGSQTVPPDGRGPASRYCGTVTGSVSV